MAVSSTQLKLCPLCSGETRFRYTIERFKPSFDILICTECGLEMQSQMPVDDAALYGTDYYSGKADYSYRDERKQEHFERFVWKARLRKIKSYVPGGGDFLDVGCAYGGLALVAASEGFRAHGLDVSGEAVRGARERGLDAHQGRITDRIFKPASMDVVTMIEVIEHLANPVEAMRALGDIIRPGGLLVIQTANFAGRQAITEGAQYHYYLPGHLHYFSRQNLESLLRANGFSRIDFYPGVEFGLLPKLQKSRGSFQSAADYARWLRIAWYHIKSKAPVSVPLTSAMVLYALRDP